MDEKEQEFLAIDVDKLGNFSSAEISNIIDAYEKKLSITDKELDAIEKQKEAKAIDMLKLRLEMKAIEAEFSAKHSEYKELRSKKKRIERKFWQAKDAGM